MRRNGMRRVRKGETKEQQLKDRAGSLSSRFHA
jgi:hypothetical protein